jgi:hypothetical protein
MFQGRGEGAEQLGSEVYITRCIEERVPIYVREG